MKGVLSWLVRWVCRAGIRDFCSALAALVGPVKNIFSSPYIISIPLSPSPSNLGRQPCWISCLVVVSVSFGYYVTCKLLQFIFLNFLFTVNVLGMFSSSERKAITFLVHQYAREVVVLPSTTYFYISRCGFFNYWEPSTKCSFPFCIMHFFPSLKFHAAFLVFSWKTPIIIKYDDKKYQLKIQPYFYIPIFIPIQLLELFPYTEKKQLGNNHTV